MTFKVSDNQFGRPHPSNSWASCIFVLLNTFSRSVCMLELVTVHDIR